METKCSSCCTVFILILWCTWKNVLKSSSSFRDIEVKVSKESKKKEEDVFCVWGHDPFKQEAAEEDEKNYKEL